MVGGRGPPGGGPAGILSPPGREAGSVAGEVPGDAIASTSARPACRPSDIATATARTARPPGPGVMRAQLHMQQGDLRPVRSLRPPPPPRGTPQCRHLHRVQGPGCRAASSAASTRGRPLQASLSVASWRILHLSLLISRNDLSRRLSGYGERCKKDRRAWRLRMSFSRTASGNR